MLNFIALRTQVPWLKFRLPDGVSKPPPHLP